VYVEGAPYPLGMFFVSKEQAPYAGGAFSPPNACCALV